MTLPAKQIAAPQREPEVDPVAGILEAATGKRLDAADAVPQRVPVAIEPSRRPLPLAVLLDERLQRADQLAAVTTLARGDRAEDRVAKQAQRLLVLQRQQQLKGAQVLIRRDAQAVQGRPGAQRQRLERASSLVEAPPGPAGLGCAPDAKPQ